MSNDRLTNRGAYANQPARMPSLQGLRVADPQVQRALESLREWVEVRLGSRGDAYEKAVTLRQFEQQVKPLQDAITRLGTFDGGMESLRSTPVAALPTAVRDGAFVALDDGRLFFGMAGAWRQVTLAAP